MLISSTYIEYRRSMLKLKVNVNLPQLLGIIDSAAQNGKFERVGGFQRK